MYGVMKKLETAVGIENIKTSDPVNFIEQVCIIFFLYKKVTLVYFCNNANFLP